MPKAKKAAAAPMTKSDFIRKFPFNTPATEIVTKAKGVNLKLTPSFVYAIRAMDKKRKRVPGAPGKPGPKPAVAATAGGRVNKSAFVRNLPATLSAAEVIAKGKAAGVKLTAAQVYTVRANAKRSGLTTDAPTAAAAPKAAAVKAPKAAAVKAPKAAAVKAPKAAAAKAPKAAAPKAAAPAADHEQHFARLVINIGLTKAEQLLERVRDRVNSL